VAREVGLDVLSNGGNAIDAAVAAALTAAVVAPYQCGIAGYGGHMTIATPGGRKVTTIDFNTAAPKASTPDMFPVQSDGNVKDDMNTYGWLASGVPGTLAGLQLALNRYGSQTLDELLQPAIRYAENGFPVSKSFATSIQQSAPRLSRDPASARIYLPSGKPLTEGALLKNAQTAQLLKTLAKRGSVDSFYRGDIAQQIAEAFKKRGGLVTADDLASYRAREVDPVELSWRGHTICTAPLTAGGTTVLEILSLLSALGEDANMTSPAGVHGWVEALRVAWSDRLQLLGDLKFTDVPVRRLLSKEYSAETATKIRSAVRNQKQLPIQTQPRQQNGTIHLSAADRKGNLVALTLTHGAAFGAHVSLDGLGLMLGSGMSRFDPRPNHPNSPAPEKRPLHNMCPTIVLRDGRAVLAVGGAGGRRIPSAVAVVLSHFVGQDCSVGDAVRGPRVHTEGGGEVWFDGPAIAGAEAHLKSIGYRTRRSKVALVSAATFDPESGHVASASG
jgi:gamma-glutamyltranspeptidase/glutathione hydrolase